MFKFKRNQKTSSQATSPSRVRASTNYRKRIESIKHSLDWTNDVDPILIRARNSQRIANLLSDVYDYLRYECGYSLVKPNPIYFEGDTIYESIGRPEQLIGDFLAIDPKCLSMAKTNLMDNMWRCQAIVDGERCDHWSGQESGACSNHDYFIHKHCHLHLIFVGANKIEANCSCGKWSSTAPDMLTLANRFNELHLNNHKKYTSDSKMPVGLHPAYRVESVDNDRPQKLTRQEQEQIVAEFFNHLATTHGALVKDGESTAPFKDINEELVESFFMDTKA